MPKAGSTQLQHALRDNADSLRSHGVWFRPTSEYFSSHADIAQWLRGNNHDEAKRLVSQQAKEAAAAGAKTVVLSAEDFAFLFESKESLSRLLWAVGEFKSITAVMVVRNLDSLLLSYLRQNIANGVSIAQADLINLASYWVGIARTFVELRGIERVTLPINDGAIPEFFTRVLGTSVKINPKERINVWGARSAAIESIIGQIIKAECNKTGAHPNDESSDKIRDEMRSFVDRAVDTPEVGQFVHKLEGWYSNAINDLVSTSIQRAEDLSFWKSLCHSPITRNDR